MNQALEERGSHQPHKTPLWKGILTALVSVSMFFALIELALLVIGVRPIVLEEDPFVEFTNNAPLFVETEGEMGEKQLATAPTKRLFNEQEFPLAKAPGTYRIFCLGGSTTYGRPYDDTVSFPGWLRELLPLVDSSRRWEVINCGGVSYASYRVANLTKELVNYDPDLFIVYSGHNEFLEERTYRGVREIPAPLRTTAALLARTRTWAALGKTIDKLGLTAAPEGLEKRTSLEQEADTKLEHFGPEVYQRDDQLSAKILQHYELSLRRTKSIAAKAGAKVIFVTPASSLRDCSPFKSEHTEGLDEAGQLESQRLRDRAGREERTGLLNKALKTLDEAIVLDPRHAELHYRRGEVLMELERPVEAESAFIRARDEDVCPLRLLSGMELIVSKVATGTQSPRVDFPLLLEEVTRSRVGHGVPGQEFFLDHVHPTVEGNRLLAVRLLEEMIAEGLVLPPDNFRWKSKAIESATQVVEGRINPEMQALGLANLANVLAWAGKSEDASRPALKALASGTTDPDIVLSAASVLANHYAQVGDLKKEAEYRRMALNASPTSPDLHFKTGLRLLDAEPPDLEAALAHIFFASVFWSGPNRDEPHRTIAKVMAERGRFGPAMSHLLEAQQIDPENSDTSQLLGQVGSRLSPEARQRVIPPMIDVQRYPSGAIERVVQVRPGPDGTFLPDALWTEWHEGGELRRFVDYTDGRASGSEILWDPSGQVLTRRGRDR